MVCDAILSCVWVSGPDVARGLLDVCGQCYHIMLGRCLLSVPQSEDMSMSVLETICM